MSDAFLLGSSGDGVELIRLTGIRAIGYHGYFPHEKEAGQPFVVDLTLQLRRHAVDDDLAATADYAEIAAAVVEEIQGKPVDLIETLAHRIGQMCLAHPVVAGAVVTVHKPEAPMAVQVQDASVTIVRKRP